MTLTNARATFGLNAKATTTKSGSSGTLQIGGSNQSVSLTSATKIISFDAVVVGVSSNLTVDISDLDNTGSTAWTAGTAQVETAPVTVTTVTTGTMAITLTSGVVTGSPLAVNVPLVAATHTTAALVAQAAVDALNALPAVSAYYTATRSTASIVLTRKVTSTYTVNGTSITVKPADDATLKLEWSALLGVSALVASTSTTAGVATAGTYCPDLDGTDFEGEATAGLSFLYSVAIENSTESPSSIKLTQNTVVVDYSMSPGGILQVANSNGISSDDITVETQAGADGSALVTITIIGS